MVYCTNCGFEINNNNFCGKCGTGNIQHTPIFKNIKKSYKQQEYANTILREVFGETKDMDIDYLLRDHMVLSNLRRKMVFTSLAGIVFGPLMFFSVFGSVMYYNYQFIKKSLKLSKPKKYDSRKTINIELLFNYLKNLDLDGIVLESHDTDSITFIYKGETKHRLTIDSVNCTYKNDIVRVMTKHIWRGGASYNKNMLLTNKFRTIVIINYELERFIDYACISK